jgi:hypothetical protein
VWAEGLSWVACAGLPGAGAALERARASVVKLEAKLSAETEAKALAAAALERERAGRQAEAAVALKKTAETEKLMVRSLATWPLVPRRPTFPEARVP